jgi:hypothetical protein
MIKKALFDNKGKSTHKQLNILLTHALTHCQTKNQSPKLPPHPHLEHIIQEQSAIGWDQILTGRWSIEWVQIYNSIYPEQGEKYSIQQISSIWQEMIGVWKSRCNLVHGTTAQHQADMRNKIRPTATVLYGINLQFDIIDRQALEQIIEVTMSLPISRLKE